MNDKKQQCFVKVGNIGTLITEMNWRNGLHVSLLRNKPAI
jgi:hypothetical protein